MKLRSSNGRICGRHNEIRSMLTLNGGKGTLEIGGSHQREQPNALSVFASVPVDI